jgi:retinol dehydrogenase-12
MPIVTKVKLNGKVALITGANSGIGRITARELALQGYKVFFACRSLARTTSVLEEITRLSGGSADTHFLELDLADLSSVRRCADNFLRMGLSLDLLVCNAGLAGQKGYTKSGFELAFGTCHVGHFLLTQLLLDRIKKSKPARIVVVSSKAHRHSKSIDFDNVRLPTQSRTGLPEYGVAKLANLLFVKELARRLERTGVTTYAVHPGVVATEVWRGIPKALAWVLKRFMRTAEQGATTSLHCATASHLASESGLYYVDCAEEPTSPVAMNQTLAAELWRQSELWVAGR